HLGSAAVVTNGAGAVVHCQAYLPYGEDRLNAGSFTPVRQFNDKEREPTGYYDYEARLYDPVTGRFLSPDSATPENYVYTRNNPIRYRDPTGHWPDEATKVMLKFLWNELAGDLLTSLQNDFAHRVDPLQTGGVQPHDLRMHGSNAFQARGLANLEG